MTKNGLTPYEFASARYQPETIWKSSREIPADTLSWEFAKWITEGYRLAMCKGIEIGREWERQRKAAEEEA